MPATGRATTSAAVRTRMVSGRASGLGAEPRATRPRNPETARTTRYMTVQVRSFVRSCSSAVTASSGRLPRTSEESDDAEEPCRHEDAEREQRERTGLALTSRLPDGADDHREDEGEQDPHDGRTTRPPAAAGPSAGSGSSPG